MIKKLTGSKPLNTDLAALILRVVMGFYMILNHGWVKASKWDVLIEKFEGPFGMPPALALPLILFAELVCSILIISGLFTRLATIPLIIAMAVAAFWKHAGLPLAEIESPITYMAAFTALFFLGSGKYSLDKTFFKR